MKKSKAINIEGRTDRLIATELTVRELKEVIDGLRTSRQSTIDLLFPEDIPAIGVASSLGMTLDDLEAADFAPSELDQILGVVKEINPFFVKAVERLASIGRKLAESRSTAKA